MDRNFYFIGIAFFGMVNGLFNQTWVLFALIHVQILAPALLFGSVALTEPPAWRRVTSLVMGSPLE